MREFTITVEVKPGAKRRAIAYDDARKAIVIRTTAVPERGKANQDVVDMLAEHFGVPKSCVELLRGGASKKKIFKIMAP
jgi:uncharacterized protein (TIGR00251 family)